MIVSLLKLLREAADRLSEKFNSENSQEILGALFNNDLASC